jgi:hypothetical protein
VAGKPLWGCHYGDGHGMEEEVKGLMKCGRHVFYSKAWDLVRACGLVVWGTAKGLLHDRWCDTSLDHRDGGGRCWSDVSEPRERRSGRECRNMER